MEKLTFVLSIDKLGLVDVKMVPREVKFIGDSIDLTFATSLKNAFAIVLAQYEVERINFNATQKEG
jgi:hypothetical protein